VRGGSLRRFVHLVLCVVKNEYRQQSTNTMPYNAMHPPRCNRGVSVMEDEGVIADHLSGVSATDGQVRDLSLKREWGGRGSSRGQ